MGLKITLQHVTRLDDGKYRYRRRYPQDVRAELGWEYLRKSDTALSDSALLRWYQDREADFDVAVRSARSLTSAIELSDRQLHETAHEKAHRLLKDVIGLDDQDARAIVAEGIASKYPVEMETGDPTGISRVDAALITALMEPDAETPAPTMADVKSLYLSEIVGDAPTERGRKNRGDTERVFRYAEEALRGRAKLPLAKLGHADAIKVRDFMLRREVPGKQGETLAPRSVRRYTNILAAAWAAALKGFDLKRDAKAVNIFEDLNIPQERTQSQQNERDPLPYPVITAMWSKLHSSRGKAGGTLPQLRLIWRLLAGTGCRVSEITGLRVRDVRLSSPVPHLRVDWHADRRAKNTSSIRSVPLVGDALAAATEAVEFAGKGKELFPAYYGNGGGSRLSAALMKHLRAVRTGDDPTKQVIHSLRHNMADWLRLARVETRTENLILGHALGGVGARVYGGSPADLELTHEAMLAAHERAERDMGTTIAGGPLSTS